MLARPVVIPAAGFTRVRLQELLYTRFKPTPLTVEMLQVEQENSESVDDYIHRVMKMCADANLEEIQLMTKAMRGLNATIARIVMPKSRHWVGAFRVERKPHRRERGGGIGRKNAREKKLPDCREP
ncbi:Hypothetical predicted protein [Mytilus galloprovincialis]|uniref:Retrotransposon gag domain-containing protein n=1 Tax=Mytilus galloprovincialis TaxID=29158 RepID=A0A8B6GA55_MYTGA|nr:Hypothetical predicted protein [Mytilus galloprovincialis]